MKPPILDAFSYTENEVMRKQPTVSLIVDEIIRVTGTFVCNSQTKDGRLDLALKRNRNVYLHDVCELNRIS